MDAETVVRGFIAAWTRRDRTALAAAMHPDVICEGISLPPVAYGREQSLAIFEPFLVADELDWRILNIASAGRSVFTERLDRFRYPGMDWTTIRACGYFEVDNDGLITLWRDYFDREECIAAMPPATQ
ncbi:MAG: hypothetical protein RIS85_2619 [Pseudomonadota bacterium]